MLFPQEWKTNPVNPLLDEAYHDAPLEQPELVAELMRYPWPRRRFLNRVFEFLQRSAPPASNAPQSESGKKHSSFAN